MEHYLSIFHEVGVRREHGPRLLSGDVYLYRRLEVGEDGDWSGYRGDRDS